ncbi:monooxygenase [Arthrobacter sp. Hiyo4]|nr:monooxygenase [Arthrobacter sp. Hiyo4]
MDDEDSRYFAGSALRDSRDQVGVIDGLTARFGKTYAGPRMSWPNSWPPTPPSRPRTRCW